MKISAFIPVYNEAHRISAALTSLSWCDEIVVLDKSSEDNTVEICKRFGAKVYEVEHQNIYSTNEFDYLHYCTGDWICIFTASDIMYPTLGLEIRRVAEEATANVSIIKVPFKNIILGVDDKKSPWYNPEKIALYRKESITINTKNVHGALNVNSGECISIPCSFGYLYHLTHSSVDIMMERHLRYVRAEGSYYEEENLKPALKSVLASFLDVVIKKTLFIGWNGIALAMAYISYYMLSFLYKWEKRYCKAPEMYRELRESVIKDWDDVEI